MKKKFLATSLSAAVLATGCASNPEPVPNTKPEPATVEIRYEVLFETTHPNFVKKTPTADITFETPNGTSQQSVSLPLKSKQTGEEGLTMTFQPGDFVYISAQKDESYGTVTCRIYAGNQVISEGIATGDYSIATCKGNA